MRHVLPLWLVLAGCSAASAPGEGVLTDVGYDGVASDGGAGDAPVEVDVGLVEAGEDAAEDASPDAALPPMKTQSFLVGYNEAWFGGNFGTGLSTKWDLAYVKKTFDGIVAGGGHVVRLWLFEVPQGYALGPAAPQTQALSPEFLANFDQLLVEARKRGLWVYPTLLDANTIAKTTGALHAYGVNLLNNTAGEQDAFHVNVVAPLAKVLDAHSDVIFGLDVINEIQAAYKNGVFPDAKNGPRAFIQRSAAFLKVKLPWLKVTASAGWPDDFFKTGAQYDVANGFYSGLGLDFYDVHVYADSGSFTGATALCNRAAADGVPVYLGEFGQSTHTVDDGVQYKATAAFLNNAKALCFKGAFAWRWDAAENWWAYVRADGSERAAVAVMKVFGAAP